MSKKITYVEDANGEILVRKKKRKKKVARNFFTKKKTLILSIIAAVIILIVATYFLLLNLGYINMKAHYDEGKIINHNGQTYTFNENLITLAFIGYDQRNEDDKSGRNGQADFLLVLALDTENSTLKGISIPRDTMVEPNDYSGQTYFGNTDKNQIAVTFSYGNNIDQACQLTTEAMSRLLYNMPLKYYYGLNLNGIGPINDAVGGINVSALETIPNTNIIQNQNIDLYGQAAQKYVQYRNEKLLESSEMRRKRDIQYAQNFYSQSLHKIRDIYIAKDVFEAASQYSSTNLGLPEFMYLTQLAMTKDISLFDIKSFKGTLKQGQSYAEFWADDSSLFETVLDVFYLQTN